MKFLAVATALLALTATAIAKPAAVVASVSSAASASASGSSTAGSATVAAAASSVSSAAPAATSSVVVPGPYSPSCNAYLSQLQTNTTLSKCRTLVGSGLQSFSAGSNSVDPSVFMSALKAYCSQPRCDNGLYNQVFKGFQTNCGTDLATLKVDEGGLSTALYQWYLSSPQSEAICLNDNSGSLCWNDIITSLVGINFTPYNLTKNKDLADYTTFFMPLTSDGGLPATVLCQSCLVQYANIFNTWFVNNPAPSNISISGATSAGLQSSLAYLYQSACKVVLSSTGNGTGLVSGSGSAQAPVSGTATGSGSSSTSSSLPGSMSDAASSRNTAFGAVVAFIVLSVMMV